MGLKNYKPARHEIPLQGNEPLSIRGLSLEDISRLINHHLPDIEAIFDLFQKADIQSLDDSKFERLVKSVVAEAPGLAANLIALACDEPDAAENAAFIPFPVQVEAIKKIGDLTFVDVGGWGKGMESIAALLRQTNITKKLTKETARVR